MSDWQNFKKSFTQKQEDAIWQYFIDHSKLELNGFWYIRFHVRDMDDFWKRLHARYTEAFRRYDKLEKAHQNEMLAVYMFKKSADKMGRKCEAIDKSKDYPAKIILWLYRKSREYVLKYETHPL